MRNDQVPSKNEETPVFAIFEDRKMRGLAADVTQIFQTNQDGLNRNSFIIYAKNTIQMK